MIRIRHASRKPEHTKIYPAFSWWDYGKIKTLLEEDKHKLLYLLRPDQETQPTVHHVDIPYPQRGNR